MVAMLTSWLLLILFCVAELALGTGSPRPVDIFAGEVDILQLRINRRGSKLRNALFNHDIRKWNQRDRNGNVYIPEIITGYFGSKEHRNIQEAMKRMEDNTCIRFINRTRERDYVEIKNMDGQGCYTNVGRVYGNSVLQLEWNQYSTCLGVPTIQQELLHVAGLWHEHMRHDRDEYIRVRYENIRKDRHDQFHKVRTNETTTYNIRYDYYSLMHYRKTAFGVNGKITMETKDPKYMDVIGTQEHASWSDYLKVCYIYDCARCMGRSMNHRREGNKPKPWKLASIRKDEKKTKPWRLAPQRRDENKRKRWRSAPQGPKEYKRKPWKPGSFYY